MRLGGVASSVDYFHAGRPWSLAGWSYIWSWRDHHPIAVARWAAFEWPPLEGEHPTCSSALRTPIYAHGAIYLMESWGLEPQIPPCHGGVIPFHYDPGSTLFSRPSHVMICQYRWLHGFNAPWGNRTPLLQRDKLLCYRNTYGAAFCQLN